MSRSETAPAHRFRPSRRGTLSAVLFTLCFGAAVPAAAQRADTLTTEERALLDSLAYELSPLELDSLIVDILRMPVALDRQPYSISVLGEPELFGAKSLVSLDEVLEGLPGVQVNDRFNDAVGEQISIRGFGSRAQFGVRGIQILVDGIPATMADGQSNLEHLDLGTLGRVEVLRGPASMLYGGAAGGVLVFESRAAALSAFEQDTRVSAGSDGFYRINAAASGTSGNTGYLLGLGAISRDGFRLDPTNPSDTWGGSDRAQMNGRVTQRIGDGELAATLNVSWLDAENPGSLSDSLLNLNDRQAFRFNVLQQTGKETLNGQLGVRWTTPLTETLDTEVSAWGLSRDVENPIPNRVIDLDRTAAGVRGLVRGGVPRSGSSLRWLAGADLSHQRDDRLNFGNERGRRTDLVLDQFETVTATGLFANTLLDVTSRVTVAAGIRYDRADYDVDDAFLQDGIDDSGSRVMDAWSPSGGVTVDARDWLNLYANVATAFLTPTTTELANRPDGAGGFNPTIEPQTNTTWEIGARGRLGSRAVYQLTGFRTSAARELIPFEVQDQPGRTFFRNAGESRYKGVEALLYWRPLTGLSTRLSYTYIDARFRRFRRDDVDVSGNRVPGTAPQRLDALARVENARGFFEVHGEFVDEIPVNDEGTREAPASKVFDIRGGLKRGTVTTGAFQVMPFAGVTNVFDERYVSSVVVNAFGQRFFEPGPGRRFYVGLEAGWARR